MTSDNQQIQNRPQGQRGGPAEHEVNLLATAAMQGDRRAVHTLLTIIRPLVLRYCRPRVSSERAGMSADDVAQEICLTVLKALPSYKEQGKPFLAFVYGIAAHKVVDAHRYAGRDRSDPTDDLPEEQDVRDGPEQTAMALTDSANMRKLLEQLPAKQRDILVMRVVVGLSEEETAEAVGSTPGAVRVAQHRALAKLRRAMADSETEVPVEMETARAVSGSTSTATAFVDEVFADPEADALVELSESIEGRDPKEFRAHQALIEDIAAAIDVEPATASLAEAYRHRQMTKHVAHNIDGHLEVGVRAVLDARRRRLSKNEQQERPTL